MKQVVLQDSLLHGLDLQLGVPMTLATPTGTGPLAKAPKLTGSSLDRKDYRFELGDLGAGGYSLSFQARVIPGFYTPQSVKGKVVTNSATLYSGGQWKGNASLNTPISPSFQFATERASVSSSGGQGDSQPLGSLYPSISADGRFVAFVSVATSLVSDDSNGQRGIFVRDRLAP